MTWRSCFAWWDPEHDGEPLEQLARARARPGGTRAADELRLLQLESREQVEHALRRAGWIAAGVFCLCAAWIGLLAAAVVALDGSLSLEARLGVLAASQGVLGAALLVWARRRRR